MNTELLKEKAEMLEEYFSVYIDSNGNLSRLPVILDQYTPDMDRVPEFLLCLGNDVSSAITICTIIIRLFVPTEVLLIIGTVGSNVTLTYVLG